MQNHVAITSAYSSLFHDIHACCHGHETQSVFLRRMCAFVHDKKIAVQVFRWHSGNPAPFKQQTYTHHRIATGQNQTLTVYLQVFNYAAFCELLQPCNQPTDTRVQMLPRYQRLKEVLYSFNPDMSLDSPFAIQPLTQEGENRMVFLMGKLHHKVVSTRVSARELLGDYDPHCKCRSTDSSLGCLRTSSFG